MYVVMKTRQVGKRQQHLRDTLMLQKRHLWLLVQSCRPMRSVKNQ